VLDLLDYAGQHVAPADLRELNDANGQPIIARLPEGWVWSDSAEGQRRMASVQMPDKPAPPFGGVGMRRFIVYLRRLITRELP
jgi:hypothetical protein